MKSTSLTLRPGLKARGFTLMELLVVMTIIGIRFAMAAFEDRRRAATI